MALPKDVQGAVDSLECEIADPEDCTAWQTIRAHLLSQDAELKILRVKCSGTLANNICPDHRDKQVGNPCLACTIEKLQSRLAAAYALLRECRRLAAHFFKEAKPGDLYERIDAHLSENTHDRA